MGRGGGILSHQGPHEINWFGKWVGSCGYMNHDFPSLCSSVKRTQQTLVDTEGRIKPKGLFNREVS